MKKLLFFIMFLPILVQGQIITTIAGNGYYNGSTPLPGGYNGDNIPATAAELNYPVGVTVDNIGNVYIADQFNRRVRKVDPTGIITTIAGNGTVGCSGDNGPATASVIGSPVAITVDGNGNIFIVDGHCLSIRKINTSGIITTIAGNGTPGYSGDGGPATAATFEGPTDVAVDTAGNIFIADATNYVVRKIDTLGIISTVAGNGVYGYSGDGSPATSAEFAEPVSVAVDNNSNIYIADYGAARIRKVSFDGIVTTIAGKDTSGYSGDGSPATLAKLNDPTGVKVDSHGNIFIADNYGRIREISVSGVINTVAGGGTMGALGDGGPATAAFLPAYNLALDSHGNIYIADFDDSRIRFVNYSDVKVPYLNAVTSEVKLWPNPSSNNFFITEMGNITHVGISDLAGRIVYSNGYNAEKVEIDISDLPEGMYVAHITDAYGRRTTKKIVKQ